MRNNHIASSRRGGKKKKSAALHNGAKIIMDAVAASCGDKQKTDQQRGRRGTGDMLVVLVAKLVTCSYRRANINGRWCSGSRIAHQQIKNVAAGNNRVSGTK